MDEPTTSLDLGHSQLVLELTDELRRERGSACCAPSTTSPLQPSSPSDCSCFRTVVRSLRVHRPKCSRSATSAAFFGAEVEVLTGRLPG